jgi:hypothetical protein
MITLPCGFTNTHILMYKGYNLRFVAILSLYKLPSNCEEEYKIAAMEYEYTLESVLQYPSLLLLLNDYCNFANFTMPILV